MGLDTRCVIEGLPRVGFYQGSGSPEDDMFPSAIKSFLQWRDDDLGMGSLQVHDKWHAVHEFLMGSSGAAFWMGFEPKNWDLEATSLLLTAPDPMRAIRQALESVGYACDVVLRKDFADRLGVEQDGDPTQEDLRGLIVESIRDRGLPVLAIGVVGPPEVCLLAGYDNGGETLVGWSGFQVELAFNEGLEFEESGYFRKSDWFSVTQGLILIGEKKARPERTASYCKAIESGIEKMQTSEVGGLAVGQRAYEVWREQLLDEARFEGASPSALTELHTRHHMLAGTLAEARAWGANFLRYAAQECPEAADELHHAAHCFGDIHDLVWAIWEFTSRGHMPTPEAVERFGSRYVRARIAPLVRLCANRDRSAVRQMEAALPQIRT